MHPQTVAALPIRPVPPSPDSHDIAVGEAPLVSAFRLHGAAVRFSRNTEVYGESERAEYFYQVVSGAVRTYKVMQDGRRQIGAFYLPGDVFGLEGGVEHAFSAEAVVDSCIRIARRSTIWRARRRRASSRC